MPVGVVDLVARRGGVCLLRRAFPRLRIVCAALDDELREGWLESPDGGRKVWDITPGMGVIGAPVRVMGVLAVLTPRRRSVLSVGRYSRHRG